MSGVQTPQRVVVTGGCGFVGRHLVDALAARGDAVTVLDIHPTAHRDDVTYLDVDIRDAGAVAHAIRGHDIVYHNASVVHTKQNQSDAVWAINHGGTVNVIDACRRHGVPRLVYNSSASVVYDGGDIENGDESLPYASTSQAPYADSKIAAERDVLAANSEALRTCAIRPHVVFGPHDARFLPAILERAAAGKLTRSVGKGDKLSDFTYVDNLIDALLAAGDRLTPGSPVCGQAYFITNGEPSSFFGITNKFLAELGYPQVTKSVPAWLAYAAAAVVEFVDTVRGGELGANTGMSRFAVRYMCTHHYFNIAKARRDLAWTPRVSIDEGVKRTVAALG